MNKTPSNTQSQTYDIAIIGGGVNGCGIARDAAGRGMSVLLLEQGDLASATSSASTKMIHGGLRYLEQYEFLMVRKALKEREVMLKIAPHIVSTLRLVLPHHKALRPKWMIRIGLFLYDTLGGRKLLKASTQVDLRTDETGKPLKPQFSYGFEYADCRVDDARLVILNGIDAKQHGANIKTRCQLTTAHRRKDHWELETTDTDTKTKTTFKAAILINAGGPWVSEIVTKRVAVDAQSHIRLVKGSHIVVPKLFDHEKAYIFQNADNRVIFAIPYYEDFTLIGTTDVDMTGNPGGATTSDEEITYLCDAANEYFTKSICPDDVVWNFSGIRPLFDDGKSSASETTRDYVLELLDESDAPPLLSIFGGKITTYRVLAETVLDRLKRWLPQSGPSWTADKPLPGGDFGDRKLEDLIKELQTQFSFIDLAMAQRLIKAYGTNAVIVLEGCKTKKDLGKNFGTDLYQREVEYLVENEWARTAEDIVWRRSKTGLFMTSKQIADLDKWLAKKVK